MDRRLGLTKAISNRFSDTRKSPRIKQRLSQITPTTGICNLLRYEDLNNHQSLREDILLQTDLGKDKSLASSPTLCRFENSMEKKEAIAIHEVLVESFIASFSDAPKELILDFNATDDPVSWSSKKSLFPWLL